MKGVQAWLEKVYRRRLTNEYDAIALVVGDEGNGKSTFMLELVGRYIQLRDGDEPDPNDVLDAIVWNDRDEFKRTISERPTQSAVIAPDAARVLHRKEAMKGEQVEIEKDLLDIRTKEFLMAFGYQDWGVVAKNLAERRAHFVFRIPSRGRIEAYSRSKIDEKQEMERDEWPEPDWVDTFPDLSGTDLWDAYQEKDLEMKNKRMGGGATPEPDDIKKREQLKVALRACKPWDESRGMTQEDAADYLLDYSPTWVSRKFKEWRNGEWDELVEGAEGVEGPPPGAEEGVQVEQLGD